MDYSLLIDFIYYYFLPPRPGFLVPFDFLPNMIISLVSGFVSDDFVGLGVDSVFLRRRQQASLFHLCCSGLGVYGVSLVRHWIFAFRRKAEFTVG